MKKLFLIPLIIVLVSGLIFGGCARPAPAPAPPVAPIKIGVMYPLTGPVCDIGEMMVKGTKLGFAEVGYEVAGRKIELIVEDSAGLPDIAVDKARKLVEHDRVCMIMGPLLHAPKLAVAAYMSKVGKPQIAPHPSPWEITEQEWAFPFGGTAYQYCYPMGLHAYDEMGLRTVTVITMDIKAGHVYLGRFMDAFKKRGGQVLQEQYAAFPCVDFAPYLAVLKDADAVVAWFHGTDTMRFLTQFHEFGIRRRMPLVGAYQGSFIEGYILHELAPEVAEAMIGERVAMYYTILVESEASKRFVEAWKKEYGETPDGTEASAYIGSVVALETLKATGGDITSEKLRQALLAVDLETIIGRLRLDPETRFGIKDSYITEVDKIGDEYMLVPVYTYKDVPPRGF